MKTSSPTFPLRLPASIKAEAEKLAAEDGVSLNSFVSLAVAEKVSAIRTAAAFFAERGARANPERLRELLDRPGGELPRPGDELPPGYVRRRAKRASKKA